MTDDVIVLLVPSKIPRFTNAQRTAFKRRYEKEHPLPNDYDSWNEFWSKCTIYQQMPRSTSKAYVFEDTTVLSKHDHHKFTRWWAGCFVGKEQKKKWWQIF